MHQSVDKIGYFLDSLITLKSLKLVDTISNQCYLIFLLLCFNYDVFLIYYI